VLAGAAVAAIIAMVAGAGSATAAPGDPDVAFSADGKTTTNFDNVLQFAEARGVAAQSTGKLVLGGSSTEGGSISHFALIRLDTNGVQDNTFGSGGAAKVQVGDNDLINDVATYPADANPATTLDDRIVAVGFASGGPNNDDFAVARFLPDGAPDTSFGPGGVGYFRIDLNTNKQDRAASVAIQDDGKILIAGWSRGATTNHDVAIVRLNTDGSLDTTFDGDGKLVTAYSTGIDDANSIIVIGTGASRKILIGGLLRAASNPGLMPSVILMAQYTTTGAADSTFGTAGVKTHDIPGNNCPDGYGCGERILDMAVAPGGTIAASGSYMTYPGNAKTNMLTARFTANGSFDTTFSTDGYDVTSIAPSYYTDLGASVAVQGDGKIVTFGWSDQSDFDLVPADHDFIFVRHNTNGTKDTTYDGDGIATVELSDGNSFDDGDSMLLDSSGRAVGVGLRTEQNGNSYIGWARLTTSGALDTTFGPTSKGFYYTQLIGGSRDEAAGVAVQADGKLVAAGWTDVGSNNFDFGVARYNTDGTLDTSFSGDGLARGGNGTQVDTARAVAIQGDGKIVVVGDSYGTLAPSLTIMRFTTAGVLDTTFDGDGVLAASYGTNATQASAVAFDATGRIVVAGTVSDAAGNWDVLVARYSAAGVPDTSFDGDGRARLDIGQFDEIRSMGIQPDGKIVIAGRTNTSSQSLFLVARYNTNGALDTTFGSPNGYVTTRVSHAANPFAGDEVRGMALLSEGKIVVGGKALNADSLNAFALARYNANGSLDTSFDTDGKTFVNFGTNRQDEINGLAVQLDEKIMAFGTGYSLSTGVGDMAVARFNWDDGSLDSTTYGASGVKMTDFAGYDRAAGGLVLPGGRAVMVGTTGSVDYAVARYLGDPAPTMPSLPDLAAASDSGISATDNITKDSTPTFTGTCVTGETTVLEVDSVDTTPVRSRARCIDGVYAVTAAVVIPDGVHAFRVYSMNGAGSSSKTSTLSVTIDTVALPLSIIAPANAAEVNPSPTISGSVAEPNAAVAVTEGVTAVCSTTATAAPAWSCASTLLPGSHTVAAVQTDIAGNTSTATTRTFAVKAPTTTALTSNTQNTVFGQPVTFTATVTSAYGTPNGSVNFTVDALAPVTGALVNGEATVSISNMSVGAHSISAQYTGATLYFPSTAPTPRSHTVTKASTTTGLTAAPSPSVTGQSVTFTATVAPVAPGAGTPSGTVTFKEGAATLGSGTVNAGQASMVTSSLSVGTHSVTAEYGGDGSFLSITSSQLSHTVNQAPAFTASTPQTATSVGEAFSYTFTATGNPAPTFTVASGALPTGLSLSLNGELTGTPTAGGTFTFTVQAANGVLPNAVTPARTITVSEPPAFTASTPPTAAAVGAPNSYTFTASGFPAPTFSVATGTLPAGLTLASGGLLSGTPTGAGAFTFTVQAANSVLPDAVTPSITITVDPTATAPVFTASTPPASATAGAVYSYTFTATGSPAPTFTKASGVLPPGLALSSGGVLSGTPTTTGAYTFTVQAANGVLPNAVTPSRTITVVQPPVFTAASPPTTGAVGAAYSYTFTASGSPAPTFTVATGTLPPGLTLASGGLLSGTPTADGVFTFTVQAANGVLPNDVTPARTITVDPAPSAPVFTASTPPNGAGGTAYTYAFTATGFPAATFSVASGVLPPGLTLSSGGVLSGTPTTVGASTFAVQATNGVQPNAVTPSRTVNIDAAPVFTASTPTTSAAVGSAYSYTFTATGTPAPTFAVATGTLPSGLTLSPAGLLSGTPTAQGVFTFTVQAVNGVLPDAVTPSRTITVAGPPAFTAASPPITATAGTAYSYAFAASGTPAPTFTVASGTLPAGLVLASSGLLSGTPTTPGVYTFAVQAANGQLPDAVTAALTITVGAPAVVIGPPSIPSSAPSPTPSGISQPGLAGGGFVPLPAPVRLMDTRNQPTVDGQFSNIGRRVAGSTTVLTVAGRGGIPADAPAIALTVTVAGPTAPGFITVFPCGQPRPLASNLNFRPGSVVANAVVTGIGAAGAVCVYTSAPTHVIVDVAGTFDASAFTPLAAPARLMDSRNSPTVDGQFSNLGVRTAGSTTELPVAGRAGVPNDASAVALTVTVDQPAEHGFITVFPCGQPRPNTSNLNFAPGAVVASAVVTGLGTGGTVCLYTSQATHVIVDASGTLAPATFSALSSPVRLMDTRNQPTVDGQFSNLGRRDAGSTTELTVGGRGGIAPDAPAVVLTVTVAGPTAPGHITVFPCGQPRPNASNVNFGPGTVVGNAVVTGLGTGGKVCVYTSAPTHVIVDASGVLH
jgi:uncharacterized delta-60 repeat protein